MPAFIRRHPVISYFVLTFAISWGGVLIAMGPEGIPRNRERFEHVRAVAIAAMLLGPSAAGLVMTAIVRGRSGYRDLLARLLTWRVGLRWYVAALLIAPLVTMGMLMALSLASPAFLPGILTTDDKLSRLLFGLTAAVAVGIAEELGWTGFATPELRRRYSILATGVIIGVLWGGWHIMGPVILASGTYVGELPLSVFLITRTLGMLIGGLPAYRVLMVWVYDRTDSLFVAMLMHMSLTACALILEPIGISGTALFVMDVVAVLVWWLVVAAVAGATGLRAVPLTARRM